MTPRARKIIPLSVLPMLLAPSAGCNAIINGWLSPIELGSFTRETTLDIRGSLGIQDMPLGVRGTDDPRPDDLVPTAAEYRAIPGDVLNVFINELRERGIESATQVTIDARGRISLPVIGWLTIKGLTAHEIEDKIRATLEEREILHDADVLIQFAAQRGLTYTIFGNEALALRVNRGPGVFPIPRPDFRLIEAISVSGGLSELVTQVYVFRRVRQDLIQKEALSQQSNASPMGLSSPDAGFGRDGDAGKQKPSQARVAAFAPNPGDGPRPITGSSRRGPSETRGSTATQAPPDKPADESPQEKDERDIQEILDFMRSEQAAPGRAGGSARPDAGSNEPGAMPRQVQRGQDAGSPTAEQPQPWIYDPAKGEWVRVQKSVVDEPVTSFVPPDETEPVPAVDWGLIAQDENDIRPIQIPGQGLRRGDPRYNIVIRPGDTIRLYSGDIGFYYVMGHVRQPGTFQFRGGASITLKNAIAAAGGLDALAWPDRVTVYRRVGGREQMIQVNLDRIFAGLESDFYLKRDDIINVGTHPAAPFLLELRNFTIPDLNSTLSLTYQFTRTETFFKNENLDAPRSGGLFP